MKSLIIILFLSVLTSAQEYGLGLILDDPLFDTAPVSAPLMRGDYDGLPSSASLRQFAPSPGSQGSFGTCTGWAAAYAGRTILEAMKHNLPSDSIGAISFSPSFVYNQIRTGSDCTAGASLIEALECLRNNGDVRLMDFGYDCSRKVTDEDKLKAHPYKILEYREVAGRKTEKKHRYIKKSIAEGKPVVLAFDCPPSFNRAGDIWMPLKSDYKEWGRGHAIAAVSYNDQKYGGAIELMNSWGKEWGSGGFTWIRYEDFDYFCKLAFEMIDKEKEDPSLPDLSGQLIFRESTGKEMHARFTGSSFAMEKTYPPGTLFELRVSNYEPAYIYAFSSDLTYKTYKIFPFTDRMTAYLPYRQSSVAIPDEESFNMIDSASDVSYYCFLYSKEALDIGKIMEDVERESGTIPERVEKVLESRCVNQENIYYEYKGGIRFSARSSGRSSGRTVVPVIVEIKTE